MLGAYWDESGERLIQEQQAELQIGYNAPRFSQGRGPKKGNAGRPPKSWPLCLFLDPMLKCWSASPKDQAAYACCDFVKPLRGFPYSRVNAGRWKAALKDYVNSLYLGPDGNPHPELAPQVLTILGGLDSFLKELRAKGRLPYDVRRAEILEIVARTKETARLMKRFVTEMCSGPGGAPYTEFDPVVLWELSDIESDLEKQEARARDFDEEACKEIFATVYRFLADSGKKAIIGFCENRSLVKNAGGSRCLFTRGPGALPNFPGSVYASQGERRRWTAGFASAWVRAVVIGHWGSSTRGRYEGLPNLRDDYARPRAREKRFIKNCSEGRKDPEGGSVTEFNAMENGIRNSIHDQLRIQLLKAAS
jgi:hypothetical protein